MVSHLEGAWYRWKQAVADLNAYKNAVVRTAEPRELTFA
jgi:hypothetical protein